MLDLDKNHFHKTTMKIQVGMIYEEDWNVKDLLSWKYNKMILYKFKLLLVKNYLKNDYIYDISYIHIGMTRENSLCLQSYL